VYSFERKNYKKKKRGAPPVMNATANEKRYGSKMPRNKQNIRIVLNVSVMYRPNGPEHSPSGTKVPLSTTLTIIKFGLPFQQHNF
jgi:hypothetical protein